MKFNFEDKSEIIQIDSFTFYILIRQLLEKLSDDKTEHKKWLTLKETKILLGVKSSTTILKLKNEGKLRYCTLTGKKIYYDYNSIMEYLNQNAQDVF